MSDILDRIIADKKKAVEFSKVNHSLELWKDLCSVSKSAKDFFSALVPLSDQPIQIIAECKKKSPSKGLIAQQYDALSQAVAYDRGGAAVISVLTEERYFGGHLDDLRSVAEVVSCPVLCKDFIVDEYQIYQARAKGADSFLLIARVLDLYQLQYFIEVGRELGMEPLIECHNIEEFMQVLETDAKVIGFNHRDLSTFATNLENSRKIISLFKTHGKGRIFVSESGIEGPQDIAAMHRLGWHAFLVGEALMRSENPESFLNQLKKP